MITDPHIQFSDRESIAGFQNERLREAVEYAYSRSGFYREVFTRSAVVPSSIRCVEDLGLLPVTTKEDLQRLSADFICVPRSEIVDYVTTSGTLGEPVTFALTSNDLDRLAYNEALSFATAGCGKDDVLQLMTTIDRRFMAGLAYFMGARELGCGVIRVGNGIPELQWDTIRRVNPTVCVVVPSFLIKLMDYAESNGIDYRRSSLRKAICIGEALRSEDFSLNALGRKISERWPELQLRSTYASTEMQTSFTECECASGGHLPPDLIIVELLDDNNRPVPTGEAGEVTITTLGVEAMPLIRFRTGDVCRLEDEPCRCGRNTIRLSPVLGRRGQMIKYKGTTLYPPAIYDVLDNVPGIGAYIVEISSDELGMDDVTLRLSVGDPTQGFEKHLKDLFRAKIRVAPRIVFDTAEQIARLQFPPMSRKAIKFIDKR